MRYTILLLLIMSTGVFKSNAQGKTEDARDKQLKQLLGMNKQQYESYKVNIKKFDKRLFDVLRDTGMNKDFRAEAIGKTIRERSAWLSQHLTEDQRNKLSEFNRQGRSTSPAAKRRTEMGERFKERSLPVNHATDTSKYQEN